MITLLKHIDRHLEYVKTFAPQLVPLRSTLIPFEDVITGQHAGPQPQGRDYDPEEEPYFTIHINDPHYSNATIWITFTANRITMQPIEHCTDRRGTEDRLVDEEVEMTLEGVFDFLRQLPRHAYSFTVDRGM